METILAKKTLRNTERVLKQIALVTMIYKSANKQISFKCMIPMRDRITIACP